MNIQWSSRYMIGEPALDAQHKVLVDAIAELQDAIEAGRAKHVLASILHKLTAYVQHHFAFEEKWFEDNHFSNLPAHRAQHQSFTGDVQALAKRLEEGQLPIGTPVQHMLLNWLYEHICVSDRAAVGMIRRARVVALNADQ
jgi:hemerythrin